MFLPEHPTPLMWEDWEVELVTLLPFRAVLGLFLWVLEQHY